VIGVEAAATLGFRDIQVGTVFQCDRVFTEDDLDRFATLSGDFSPLHMDEAYATATQFGGRVTRSISARTSRSACRYGSERRYGRSPR
jgi:3-hydroxybutyryl-CoA dehydratase